MLRAVDDNNISVHAKNAVRGKSYFCPVCGSPMILNKGQIMVHHFKHKAKTCPDTWTYDMSDWHLGMQNLFPLESQEVVVSLDGVVHRADILYDNTVIEFQHSRISLPEFNERTQFFLSHGYRMAWVFDMGSFEKFIEKDVMHWPMTWRIFDDLDFSNPNFALWFCRDDNFAFRVRYPLFRGIKRFSDFLFWPDVELVLKNQAHVNDFFRGGL